LFFFLLFFFFNDTATTEIYTLSLHDALPIRPIPTMPSRLPQIRWPSIQVGRSEEHTSELQSQSNLVCRLLLEKKKTYTLEWSKSRQQILYSKKPCSSLTT